MVLRGAEVGGTRALATLRRLTWGCAQPLPHVNLSLVLPPTAPPRQVTTADGSGNDIVGLPLLLRVSVACRSCMHACGTFIFKGRGGSNRRWNWLPPPPSLLSAPPSHRQRSNVSQHPPSLPPLPSTLLAFCQDAARVGCAGVLVVPPNCRGAQSAVMRQATNQPGSAPPPALLWVLEAVDDGAASSPSYRLRSLGCLNKYLGALPSLGVPTAQLVDGSSALAKWTVVPLR